MMEDSYSYNITQTNTAKELYDFSHHGIFKIHQLVAVTTCLVSTAFSESGANKLSASSSTS